MALETVNLKSLLVFSGSLSLSLPFGGSFLSSFFI